MKSYSNVDYDNAIAEMNRVSDGLSGIELREALSNFMDQQSVGCDGKVNLLWAGFYDTAKDIAENDVNNIRILNKTLANDILEWLCYITNYNLLF